MFKGSMVALATPFSKEGEVDYTAFHELMEWHIHSGTDAILLCGITGEAPTLSHTEQLELIKRGIAVAKGNVPIIAGTGTNNTRVAVHLTEEAKAAGADACLIIAPYYNKPTPEGCYRHFEAVNRVGLPIVVYHHPGRSAMRLAVADLARIASLSQVVGIKEGSMDLAYVGQLMQTTDVPIFSGDDVLTLAMLGQGAQGVLSIVANVIPKEWHELCACLLKGDFAQGRAIFRRYQPLTEAMVLETNPQCVKYALSLLNKCSPHLRLPMVEPQEETKQKIEAAMCTLSIGVA